MFGAVTAEKYKPRLNLYIADEDDNAQRRRETCTELGHMLGGESVFVADKKKRAVKDYTDEKIIVWENWHGSDFVYRLGNEEGITVFDPYLFPVTSISINKRESKSLTNSVNIVSGVQDFSVFYADICGSGEYFGGISESKTANSKRFPFIVIIGNDDYELITTVRSADLLLRGESDEKSYDILNTERLTDLGLLADKCTDFLNQINKRRNEKWVTF